MSKVNYQILIGDCIQQLAALEEDSVHCCVTSPPYFGLRDYGVKGQVGREASPEEYIAKLVEVMEGVRRVLRDDGSLWLNLGDSYTSGGRTYRAPDRKDSKGARTDLGYRPAQPKGLKQKELIGIPWRVALALQAAGWYLRQDIIWYKPNAMPESVKDRCTRSHEYIFLLTKQPHYYYDHEAVREEAATKGKTRNRRSVWHIPTKPYRDAHLATFPPDLITPCVLAGSPSGGVVLDPFGGSGTTAGVALKHGRNAILCEINVDYVALCEQRISTIVNG